MHLFPKDDTVLGRNGRMVVSLGSGIGLGFNDRRCLNEAVFYRFVQVEKGSSSPG
jgi:hypothetical protein